MWHNKLRIGLFCHFAHCRCPPVTLSVVFRPASLETLTGNISDMESNLVESKKVKLGIEPTLSVELSSNGSSQIASVKDATSSGKEKTEQLAPSGDI